MRILGVIAIAAILRPPVAGVGPLLPVIADSLGLSGAAVALLGSLPVLCFGFGAFLTPWFVRSFGLNWSLELIAIALIVGLSLRVDGSELALFGGTAIIGIAIALGNTILPTIIKTSFNNRARVLTGLYTTVMSGMASVAALVAVPMAGESGEEWRQSLGRWTVVAIIAAVAWLPQLRSHLQPPAADNSERVSVLRNKSAWAVAAFMGMQSIGFYSILAWLPSFLQSTGYTPSEAGTLLSICTSVGIPMGLILPIFIRHTHDLSVPTVIAGVIALVGCIGITLAPTTLTLLWLVLIGVGQGVSFPLALNIITLRGSSTAITTSLSAMSQGIGYLIAAVGTYAVGAAHTLSGSWKVALGLLALLTAAQVVTGWFAGKPHPIHADAKI